MQRCKNIIGVALLTLIAIPLFAQVSNDNEDRVNKINMLFSQHDYVPGQVLVKFKDANRVTVRRAQGKFASVSADKVTEVLQKYGTDEMEQLLPNENPNRSLRRGRAFNGETIQECDLSQLYCLKLSAEHQHETMQMVSELNTLDEIEYAEPNYHVYAMSDDCIAESFAKNSLVREQWYLTSCGVKEIWDKNIINSERPVIAIIDTGVDTEHPDLKDNCIGGYDFVNYTSNVIDDNMHGTHVAGIAAACNNEIGIIGANPQALIMPVKVLDMNGKGNMATVIQGVNYAVEHGAKVINLSLGSYSNSNAQRQALINASLNAVIVAAAGNDGRCLYASHEGTLKHGILPAASYPAAYPFVLGVQATDKSGHLASFSNYDDDGPLFSCETTAEEPDGINYELKAPGTEIISTVPGGGYAELQGTSMASPLMAGAISALMMVKNYESQELLWADLLHSDNIAQAYYLMERPSDLDVLRIILRDRQDFTTETEDDFSGKYEVNAGETVYIYPVIRSSFGEGTNIRMKLELDENEDPDIVQIVTDKADFGWHLDTGGKAVSKNPLVIKIPEGIADSRIIRMKISLTCDSQEGTTIRSFTFKAINMLTIGGAITEDRTLTANQTYYVNDDISVYDGVTLTIEPGARLEFKEGKGLAALGKLVAKGTPEKPIVFTNHLGNGLWYGIKTHEPDPPRLNYGVMYMNADTTQFTIERTELTPNTIYSLAKNVYYSAEEDDPSKVFEVKDYMDNWKDDIFIDDPLLTDPSYITPVVLRMLEDWKNYCNMYPSRPNGNKNIKATVYVKSSMVSIYSDVVDTIKYCRIEGARMEGAGYRSGRVYPFMEDCIIEGGEYAASMLHGTRTVVTNCHAFKFISNADGSDKISRQTYWNFVNNSHNISNYKWSVQIQPKYSDLIFDNYFNNPARLEDDGKDYLLQMSTPDPIVDHSEHPSYIGTGREDILRPQICEIGNVPYTFGSIDLSNMRKEPIREAHGIIWKVLVNGKDAQDEYEDIVPLGVDKHKFEVYFNRPMNKEVIPKISFGVRDPWTQNAVDEDGCWNEEGTIYTAYKTITGKTNSDGINRIFVRGAEDDEYFPCPYEKTRFNINIQAAGSMATGFAAESSVGRVKLSWDNSNNDIDDAMGYIVYRYNSDKKKTIPGRYENGKWIEPQEVPDTIRINEDILDVETSEFTDYNVIPNHTYYYFYKVLSTDLKEYDVSNIVAATPLTATLGDADGSGEVDVVDVVTTVNYVLGKKPDPFVFTAADVNADKNINVLDVVGIVHKVLNPNSINTASAIDEVEAVYTIEDGVLYVETPVALGGVQMLLNVSDKDKVFTVTSELKGFERSATWLSDNDYLFMAYSMGGKSLSAGKHALLKMDDATISNIYLCDAKGKNVKAVAGEGATNIEAMGSKVQQQSGVFNLNGQKVAASESDMQGLKHGVYIINGQKVVK